MPNPAIKKSLAQQLICASIQTYKALSAGAAFAENPLQYIGNPQGLTYVDYFQGQDVFDGHASHEPVLFGLIFSVTRNRVAMYLPFAGPRARPSG